MKRKRSKSRTVEQIIRILRQADGGQTVAEICRVHNIAEGILLSLEKAIRRYGCSRCQALESVRKRKHRVEKDVGRSDAG